MNVSIKTFGCSNNISESEVIAGLLVGNGHVIVDSSPDVCIFNMCSVKGRSVNECLRLAKKAREENKKVIITGCVAKNLVPRIKKLDPGISIINTHHIACIPELLGSVQELVSLEPKVKINLPKIRKNPLVGIVPILSGCNDACTYCYTKLVKGNTFSYPEDLIIAEARQCIRDGCKELWLTSQDNGAYLTDKGQLGLPHLVRAIASLDGDFTIRVGMANPTYLLECLDEFIEVMKLPKVFKFIHIPVQCGNNDVLKAMGRRYSVEDYLKLVSVLKKIPDIVIATDIIVGFPGETDAQFNDTLKLLEATRPDACYFSRFMPRPGTIASKMKQLPGAVIHRRSKIVEELSDRISLENNRKWVGREFDVLIDEIGKKGESIGKNFAYKQVLIKEAIPLGQRVHVKVVSASVFHLEAVLI